MKSRLESLVEEMVECGVRFGDALREFERCFILKVVERHHGNLSKTAKELGIHRNTLSNRMRRYKAPAFVPKSLRRKARKESS